jgi:mannan endo-1,4-beta-mannosidase
MRRFESARVWRGAVGSLLLVATGCAAEERATADRPAGESPGVTATVAADLPRAARFGAALDGRPIEVERLEALSRRWGYRPGWVVIFEQWPEDPARAEWEGLWTSLQSSEGLGAVPVVTWEPMYYRAADGAEIIIPAERVLGGEYDAYFDAFAAGLAARSGPVIVRLMHEMNLARYGWGLPADGYDARAPGVYQAMWRHIVERTRAGLGEAAARVAFAFCPNAESVPGPGNSPDHAWNTLSAYYPGDAWVDLVGVDGYNWGDTQTLERHGWRSHWRGLPAVLGPAVRELRQLAPTKPLHVFETASAPTGGNKAQWLREAAAAAQVWDFASLVWFEADKEIDWRLETGVTADEARAFIGALAR